MYIRQTKVPTPIFATRPNFLYVFTHIMRVIIGQKNCGFMSGLWSWLYWYFAFEYGIYRCFNILSVLITDVDHITKIKFGTFYILELLDGNHWNPWWQEIGAHPLSWHLDWSLYAKNRGLLSSDKLSFLTYPHIRNEISSTQKHFQHVFFLVAFYFSVF